jgi:tetratricopeptide (TPR) repeat protein
MGISDVINGEGGLIKVSVYKKILMGLYKVSPLLIISFVGVIAYSNTFYGEFHFDDFIRIVHNRSIQEPFNLISIWDYSPTHFITYLSFALNYHIHQLHVFGYHVLNLAIHIGSALLSWWLVRLILAAPGMRRDEIARHRDLVALFVSLIFVSHPLQTQGVTYLVQRAASLATLFYLLSLSLYIKSWLSREKASCTWPGKLYYAGSLIAAVMAIFTKGIVVTLPLTILLVELYFLSMSFRLNWKKIAPFFIISLLLFVTLYFYDLPQWLKEETSISCKEYLLTQARVVVTYLKLLFVPLGQNLDYDFLVSKSVFQPATLFSSIVLTGLLIVAVKIRKTYKLISFGVLWFFVTLLPESSFMPLNDVIFEHRLYLPMFGYCLFLAASIFYLFYTKKDVFIKIALILIIGCYAILAYQRNAVWRTDVSLWDDVVRKSPKKARAYHNRGVAYQNEGRFNEALSDYNLAIGIDPHYAEAYFHRGQIFQTKGSLDQALSDYNEAIESFPRFAEAYKDRALVYLTKGKTDQALSDLSKSLEILPGYAEALNYRGSIYENRGDLARALSDYSKAIKLDPHFVEALNHRGVVYFKQGDYNKAVADFDEVIKVNPKNIEMAYNNRGLAYQGEGDFNQAIADYKKALEVNPRYAQIYYNMAQAYYFKQEYDLSWENVHKAEQSGYIVDLNFIVDLSTASGRKR